MPFHTPPRDRLKGAVLAVLVQGAIGYALLSGLTTAMPAAVERTLHVFRVLPDPPPPPARVVPPPQRVQRPTGAAAPPNLRSKATEVVAPIPVVPLPAAPVVIALAPALGAQSTSGASDRAGPGTGAGGLGDGPGAGGYGDGDGNDGETPPRWRKGRLKRSDSPLPDDDVSAERTVGVRYTVTTQGRVANCRITRSSGSPLLDQTTCRLIEQRFRYDPARDEGGRPVESTIVENHTFASDVAPPGD